MNILKISVISLSLAVASIVYAQVPDSFDGATVYLQATSGDFFSNSDQTYRVKFFASTFVMYDTFVDPEVQEDAGAYTVSNNGSIATFELGVNALLPSDLVLTFETETTGTFTYSAILENISGTFTSDIPSLGTGTGNAWISEWSYTAFFPWIYSPSDGWLFFTVVQGEAWLNKSSTGEWLPLE